MKVSPGQLILLLVILAVSLCLCSWVHVPDYTFINSMVWNLLGLLGGVMVASVVFLIQVADQIRRRALEALIRDNKLSENGRKEMDARFDAAMDEVRSDVYLLLICVAVAVLAVFWGNMDIPLVRWATNPFITKIQTVHGIILWSICVCLLCVRDCTQAMFRLRDIDREG